MALFHKHYDLVWDRPMEAARQVETVLELANGRTRRPVESVLEVGCGTGRHTVEFARHGLKVVAMDTDEEMLKIVARKTAGHDEWQVRLRADLLVPRPKNILLPPGGDGEFDLVTALGNVSNYVMEFGELVDFYRAAFEQLRPGGVFVVDCWNGISAIVDLPWPGKDTWRTTGDLAVHCSLRCTTNRIEQHVLMDYTFTTYQHGDDKPLERDHFSFEHRLWTKNQLADALKLAGFTGLRWSVAYEPNTPINESARALMCVAQS